MFRAPDVEPFADAGRGVPALQRNRSQKQVAQCVHEHVPGDGECRVRLAVAVGEPPAVGRTQGLNVSVPLGAGGPFRDRIFESETFWGGDATRACRSFVH